MLGSAAIIVMDEDACIVDAAQNLSKFFSHESCGQCTPCREGTPWLHKVLTRIEEGEGRVEDVDLLDPHLQPDGERHDDLRLLGCGDRPAALVGDEVPRRVPAPRRAQALPGGREGRDGDGMSSPAPKPPMVPGGGGAPSAPAAPPPPQKDTFTVIFDGKPIEVPKNLNLIDAAKLAGIDIPHFCYHPRLSVVGQCRMCLVEIEGIPKIQAACTTPLKDGLVGQDDDREGPQLPRRDDGVPAHQPSAGLPDLRPGRRVHAPGQLLRLRAPALQLRRDRSGSSRRSTGR